MYIMTPFGCLEILRIQNLESEVASNRRDSSEDSGHQILGFLKSWNLAWRSFQWILSREITILPPFYPLQSRFLHLFWSPPYRRRPTDASASKPPPPPPSSPPTLPSAPKPPERPLVHPLRSSRTSPHLALQSSHHRRAAPPPLAASIPARRSRSSSRRRWIRKGSVTSMPIR